MESERNNFFGRLKKTNEIGRSRLTNERNENNELTHLNTLQRSTDTLLVT